MSLVALMPAVPNNGTSLLRYSGTPKRAVVWSIQSGPGAVAPLSAATDSSGTAYAIFDPQGGAPDAETVVRATSVP